MNCYKCNTLGLLKYNYKVEDFILGCCDCSQGKRQKAIYPDIILVDRDKLKYFEQINIKRFYKDKSANEILDLWKDIIASSNNFWKTKYTEKEPEFKMRLPYKDN